jgi:transcriptional regulator with XRE-family HTH domain
MTENNNTDNWKHEMGSRLLELRKHYGCSQLEMAEKVGLKINTYRKNETGINYPSVLIINRLRNRLGVSLEWYLFGRGPVFWADVIDAQEKSAPDDVLGQEIEDMTGMMKEVPMIRHAILLYFQELKVKHKDLIREIFGDRGIPLVINK